MKNIILFDVSPNSSLQLQETMASLGNPVRIEQNIREFFLADGIIIYGIGSFKSCIEQLQYIGIDGIITQFEMPILGISIGMQLFGTYCTEDENATVSTEGFSLLPIRSSIFLQPKSFEHKGLSAITSIRGELLSGIDDGAELYFQHRTKMLPSKNYATSLCGTGELFSSSIEKDNLYGVEFLPEQSGELGKIILQNYINLL